MKSLSRLGRRPCVLPVALVSLLLGSCQGLGTSSHEAAAKPTSIVPSAAPPAAEPQTRINGKIVPDTTKSSGPLVQQIGHGPNIGATTGFTVTGGAGDISLNYVDTDIREIIRVVLGDILKANYTIDSNVQGSVTIQTAHPVSRQALLPTLQSLLSQVNAEMVARDGVYRIAVIGNATVVPPLADAAGIGLGTDVVPLRYASAQQLSAMLAPYIGSNGKMIPDAAHNVLLVTGSLSTRESIINLVRVFDVDSLAGRSYALYPVTSGDPDKVAKDLSTALQADSGGTLADSVDIVPLDQANALMIIASQPAYLNRAAQMMADFDRVKTVTGRNLHVYFLKNSQAADMQPLLQRAFNPPQSGENAAAGPGGLPPTAVATQVLAQAAAAASPTSGSSSQSPQSSGAGMSGSPPSSSASAPQSGSGTSGTGGSSPAAPAAASPAEVAAAAGAPEIIADAKTNSLLVVSTDDDYSRIEAAIRKLDILPPQVLIEATIAEVTLNNALQYGTQFYLTNSPGYQATLTNAQSITPTTIDPTTPLTNAALFPGTLAPNFPGFSLGRVMGAAQFAIEALQSVTTVKIISSPTLLVLDKQQAQLQVGNSVPVISQNATSVSSAGAPIVNSVDYRDTGIILTVTPRIGSAGLISLDLQQEVSAVVPSLTDIGSPSFSERKISSHVVVQDGETIGLAGLISDNKSIGNSGIPLLSDIPVLGVLFSTQNNSDVRTELLMFITPHIMHDARDARMLTDELKQKLPGPAAIVP